MDEDNKDISKSIVEAEFAGLREEILKRTEIQHQMNVAAFVAIAAFLSVTSPQSGVILLCYPILGLFLAATWVHNHNRIVEIGSYIHDVVESKVLSQYLIEQGVGWEHYLRKTTRQGLLGSLPFFASRGIFVGTQILAIVVGLHNSTYSYTLIVILLIDCVFIVMTFMLLRTRLRPGIAKEVASAKMPFLGE
jgi:hypothetical protein